MLKTMSLPHSPLRVIMVTSPEGKSICSQVSVLYEEWMRVSVHVLPGQAQCMVGYTVIQFLEAIELLKAFMTSSWSATIPMSCFSNTLLLRRVCWQAGDLLTFC